MASKQTTIHICVANQIMKIRGICRKIWMKTDHHDQFQLPTKHCSDYENYQIHSHNNLDYNILLQHAHDSNFACTTYLQWHNNKIIVYISLGWIHITSVKSPISTRYHISTSRLSVHPINQQNIIISAPLWWGKWAAARPSVEVSDPENQQSPLIRLPWRFFGHWHLPHSIRWWWGPGKSRTTSTCANILLSCILSDILAC